MKKVLLSLLSVVALNATDGFEPQSPHHSRVVRTQDVISNPPPGPRVGYTQSFNLDVGRFVYVRRPNLNLRPEVTECPPAPRKGYECRYDHHRQQWVQILK